MDGSNWFRFDGEAGRNLPTTPVSMYTDAKCGTQSAAWMNGKHPQPSDGIVIRTICFSGAFMRCFSMGFDNHMFNIKVAACNEKNGDQFFVYQLKKPINCDWFEFGYCAE